MKKFVFAVHNHQPIGNFDHVIKEAFEKSYKPFIDLVYLLKYPKVCFHFSGILYEWFEKNERSYLDKLGEMLERGQIEILTGGYYEPILCVIPRRDRISQVKKLSDYIYRRFGVYPRGLWLSERVFKDEIVSDVVECGVEYLLVDDSHLFTSGVKDDELNNVFLTEYNGKKIKVFAINHKLRYLIPYACVDKVIEYLNSFNSGIFVMADDGEKFGLWPKSYKLVYEEKYLYNFFEAVKNSGIEMVRFSDIHSKAKKLVYIADTSYFEMSTWALDPGDTNAIEEFRKSVSDDLKKFIRGGIFHNFFTKYPHSNLIHKRSYMLSDLIDKNFDYEAQRYLHMAQCNCGWWHGVFGGIYLPHIRMAIYENFLKAHKILFSKLNKKFIVEEVDIDFDDTDELLVENQDNFFIISPSYGGSIIEFSSKNKFVNYSNVIERRPEAYHLKPKKDINGNYLENPNIELFYDWHIRRTLLDHFIRSDTDIYSFSKAKYFEQGDFIPQGYELSYSCGDNVRVNLRRKGVVWEYDRKVDVEVSKDILIGNFDGFEVNYVIKNLSDINLTQKFAVEFVFALTQDPGFMELNNVRSYVFKDSVKGEISVEFSIPMKLWIFGLKTLSNSENGLEEIYQGSILIAIYDNSIGPFESKNIDIKVKVL